MNYRLALVGLILIVLALYSFDHPELTPYSFPELNHFPKMPVNPDNPTSVEGVELGRKLFYDPILSKDRTISCSSCHHQADAFADRGNSVSFGINQDSTKRNALPLFNLAWNKSYFWDGRAASLEGQVFQPVRAHNEMNLDWQIAAARISHDASYARDFKVVFGIDEIDSTYISKAIAQFERTLLSYNSKFDRVLRGEEYFTRKEYRGYILVNDQTKGDCIHCHITDGGALSTTGEFSNNGLDNIKDPLKFTDGGRGEITGLKEDYGKFRIPTLRNLAFTAPYMHDGRFKTLDDVLNFYNSGVQNSVNIDSKMTNLRHGGIQLSIEEIDTIIAFLNTLNDTLFIRNKAHSSPW